MEREKNTLGKVLPLMSDSKGTPIRIHMTVFPCHSIFPSGSYVIIDKMLANQEDHRQGLVLAERLNRSKAANYAYVCEKWNCPTNESIIMPAKCKFRRPFGREEDFPLSYWRVDHVRRACIDGDNNEAYHLKQQQNQTQRVCTYQLDGN